MEPTSGWLDRYCMTRWGEFGHCGTSEPTTAASASISSRINAVRIDRSVRQTSATDCRRVTRDVVEDMRLVAILRKGLDDRAVYRPGANRARGANNRVNNPDASRAPTTIRSAPEQAAIQV